MFVSNALGAGGAVMIQGDGAHYLARVMRLQAGDPVRTFNGEDGEWLGRVAAIGGKRVEISLETCLRPQEEKAGPWLLFAPVKKTGTDVIVEKATELGVSRLLPVITSRSQTRRVNLERMRAQVREAAEQCERLTLPEVADIRPLDAVLADWPRERRLLVAAERRGPGGGGQALGRGSGSEGPPPGFLIGPEGGFPPSELDAILKLPFAQAVSLGPRILRAETAALAALAVWQSAAGDWGRDWGGDWG